MKLYQAILAGSQLSEQGFGNEGMTGKKRCALGAALAVVAPEMESLKEEINHTAYATILKLFPILEETIISPVGEDNGFCSTIFRLNDKYKWTREAIAEWIKTIEEPINSPGEEKELVPVA